MKTRHKLIAALVALALLLAGFAAGFVVAQSTAPHTGRPFGKHPRTKQDVARRVERMTEKLSLTPEQQQQLRAILEDAVARAFPQEEERMAQARIIMDETRQQIDAILTEEQRVLFHSMHPDREPKGPPR